ncbi:DUF6378 domain-containing protein [Tomitella gaofuii]|uniref:DUF6378 domain-containing protein n=1 Tax=Tomitella gaofuii TaxID=2760083 RepID=UPI0015FD8B78|nr:DUF6378 domain-containing protein [Tomitella gaofuii]
MADVLAEAAGVVGGGRAEDYGAPAENSLTVVADMWMVYLSRKFGASVLVEARDVANMMVLLKVARDAHKPKHDNLVDIAGYVALAGEMETGN